MKKYDVVSIIDQIGEYKTSQLKNGNKFCPYWFATRKDLLMQYRDIEWGPNMPEHETLGKLTEEMLADGVKVYEWPEDKSSILFDGEDQYPEHHKEGGLGYYHCRAGSTPAVLLAWRENNPDEYWKYLKEQPKNEYLRQVCWYQYIGGNPTSIIQDLKLEPFAFKDYYEKFIKYHGLV